MASSETFSGDKTKSYDTIDLDHIYSTVNDDVKSGKNVPEKEFNKETNINMSKAFYDHVKSVVSWNRVFAIGILLLLLITGINTTFTIVYLLRAETDFQSIRQSLKALEDNNDVQVNNLSNKIAKPFNGQDNDFTKNISDHFGLLHQSLESIGDKAEDITDKIVTLNLEKSDSVTQNISDRIGTIEHTLYTLVEKVDIITDKVLNRNVKGLCSNLNKCETSETADSYQCFKFVKEQVTWHQAVEKCKKIGGFLAEVHTRYTLDYLEKIASKDNNDYWLGASDEGQEGHWRWITSGKPLSVTAWIPGEPNNGGGDEHYLHLWKDYNGKWNDTKKNNLNYFVCQKNSDTCEGWI